MQREPSDAQPSSTIKEANMPEPDDHSPSTLSIPRICQRPADYFSSPKQLVANRALTRTEKLQALLAWETDERLRMTATDENMPGGPPNQLQAIRACLQEVRAANAEQRPARRNARSKQPKQSKGSTELQT